LGGTFWQPTVLAGVSRTALLNREETFGPVAGLIRVADEDEAISIANDTRSGLAAYVYSRDIGRAWRVQEALKYGMVGVNTGLVSTAQAPFGGVKESGLGREGGSYGLAEFLEPKFTNFAI
jgi:succinate-semialdehyde dehydrogenase/glutarate-semialdehyde dehydrogenase